MEKMTVQSILFSNAAVLDPARGELREAHHVLVENGLIKEVSDKPLQSAASQVIDLKGKTLMPGLIDLHVHVVAVQLNLSQQVHMPNVLVTLRSVPIMSAMLRRGFTTVRDAGARSVRPADTATCARAPTTWATARRADAACAWARLHAWPMASMKCAAPPAKNCRWARTI
jgi:imidazolonepropionase-like amidohydrolase